MCAGAATPLASVIVPTWNGAHLLPPCLDSLAAQRYRPLEVVVADGGSTDGTAAMLGESYPWVRLQRLPTNRGFAGNVNAGLRAARGDPLLLLNNDAIADENWVGASVEAIQAGPAVGAVASKILYFDGTTINSAGDGITRRGRPYQRGTGTQDGPEWSQRSDVFGASGGAAAYRRRLLEDVGVFDEAYFAYLEDVDLAFRAQLRGWQTVFEPAARVRHRGSATGGGVLASYYNGRNGVRLLVKNMPGGLLRDLWPGLLRAHASKATDALRAWRGEEARATLRGQFAGLLMLPAHVAARRGVQARRTVSDERVLSALTECE